MNALCNTCYQLLEAAGDACDRLLDRTSFIASMLVAAVLILVAARMGVL